MIRERRSSFTDVCFSFKDEKESCKLDKVKVVKSVNVNDEHYITHSLTCWHSDSSRVCTVNVKLQPETG